MSGCSLPGQAGIQHAAGPPNGLSAGTGHRLSLGESSLSRPLATAACPTVDRADPGPATIQEGVLTLAGLPLHFGGRMAPTRVAWRLTGAADAPVVAALGGISADRHVHDARNPRAGWWREVVGPGRALDTLRYRVLGIDWFVPPGETTPVDTRDQARALLAVCDHLGIAQLHALAGASYGGMVGLALAEIAPDRLRHLLVIGAAHRSDALSTAWRAIQREIVRHARALGDAAGGLRIARALAMTTYRTRAELNSRFPGGVPGDRHEGFTVEAYLFARGADYARRHAPDAFLCLSESIDLHRVDPARIGVPVTLVAFREDQLVPVADARELAAALSGPCRLVELDSRFGHDAFLKEGALLAPAFAAALEGTLP